jgi:hypothetical protein
MERPLQCLGDHLPPGVELGLAQRLWLQGAHAQLAQQAAHIRDAGFGGQDGTPGASARRGVRHGRVSPHPWALKMACEGTEK